MMNEEELLQQIMVNGGEDDDFVVEPNQLPENMQQHSDVLKLEPNKTDKGDSIARKIKQIKKELSSIEEVSSFNIDGIDSKTDEELVVMYDEIKSCALAMGGGSGIFHAGYGFGLGMLESLALNRGYDISGLSTNALSGQNEPSKKIIICLTLLEIEYLGDLKPTSNPMTVLLLSTGMLGVATFQNNKIIKQLKSQNEQLQNENQNLRNNSNPEKMELFVSPEEMQKLNVRVV